MSDDKNTEKRPDPQGRDCPAAQPLCLCGIRGCPNAAIHAVSLGGRRTRRRLWRR